jgi:dipeptidyl aminopeptidase/acylaminoacyl peptidase
LRENNIAKLIPRSLLFGNPDKIAVSLSPNGQYLSYIAPYEGVLNIYLAKIDDMANACAITFDKKQGIRSYSWAYDSKHVIYSQDHDGDENTKLYTHNIIDHKTTLHTPAHGVKANVAALSKNHKEEIIIASNERDKKYFDLYSLNLLTYKQTLLFKNEKYTGFIIDDALKIRFADIQHADGSKEYFKCENNAAGHEFSSFMKIDFEDASNTALLGLNTKGDLLYYSDSRNANTAALKELNLQTNADRIIYQNNHSDVEIFTTDLLSKEIQSVYYDYLKPEYKVLDASIAADFTYLTSINSGFLHINARTLDDKIWLVCYRSDHKPIEYYLYERKEQKATYLFSNNKALAEYKLQEMQSLVIKARDGLDLVSYLTLPATPHKKPLPMVLYVHGGPWVRDSWGYNSTHQWLANRGYGVLSVNYRGSAGFGKDFLNAGNKEWSGKMHDDLIDAVNWAVKEGIADAKKIVIMGGSYGGYATLVGLTFTPDVFAAGIDIVGPSNLLTLLKTVPAYWQPILPGLKKIMGDWETTEGQELLKSCSPLIYAHKIKKPLFIAQGANDPVVNQAESEQIVAALKSKNIPVLYALYENEGHGFARPKNRISFYAMSEYFLAKILHGEKEPISDEELVGTAFLLNQQKISNHNELETSIDENSFSGKIA